MKHKWKIILGSIIFLAAFVFIIIQAMVGEEVEVKELSYQDIKRSFTEDGTIKAKNERYIHSLTGAKIEELLVSEGDKVEKGDLIAVLDHSKLDFRLQELDSNLRALEGERKQLEKEPGEAEIKNIELNIEKAMEDKEHAKRNYERIESLYENNYISRHDYEEARKMFEEAKHNLKLQENSLEALKEAYEAPEGSEEVIEARKSAIYSQINYINYQKENYYEIDAPISGIVTDVEAEEGRIVSPELPFMKIFEDNNYELETKLLTRDIFEISEGMTVNLTHELRDEDIEFKGTVTKISSQAVREHSPLGIEEERVGVAFDPDIPEDLNLGPGYKVDVEFTIEEKHDELAVPSTAVFSHQGEDAVLVIKDGKAEIQKVTTGFETRNEVVITRGLERGDKVIIDPRAEGIEEGARISNTIRQNH